MSVEFRLEGNAAEKMRQLAGAQLDSARSALVRSTMRTTLQAVVQNNPVETGRSRAAWVSSLEELGGTPPAGWEGSHPTGVAEGRQLGALDVREDHNISEIQVRNATSYISSLEYGTSRMAPAAMARRSLAQITAMIRSLFRW